MHLKEVRMYNFKSFGEKLVVPFKPGFTAITGPNGSGKSNIGDAILFVLGPRSTRKIRAKTLPELIFNGGSKGKQAKECEVTLVFDNRDRLLPVDEDEVHLTRRIRRAPKRGDPNNYHSYCYVNERSANLREFIDLLKHARISAEGYNIVTQGSVNDLVTMSDLDRRKVLEEIAGITDFDKDIEGANKKRAEVEANLDRVDIILKEIRRALADLQKEREAAQRHAELTARRNELKAVFAYRKKDEIERQIAGCQQQIENWKGDIKQLTEKLEALRKEHHGTLQDQHALENEIADFAGPEGEKTKQEIRELQNEVVRLEERINYAQDQVKDLTADRRTFEAEQKKVAKELDQLEAQRKKHEADAESKAAELKRAEKDFKELRDLIGQSSEGAMRINAQLAKLKVEYEETSGTVHKASLERDRLQQRLEQVQELIAQLEENQRTYELEVKDADFQLAELTKETQASSKSLKELESRHTQLIKKQAETTKRINELDQALRRLQREYHELKALEEASKTMGQGYSRAVDAVLAARKQGHLKGIHGTIAELGKVDPKHETSLQVAAGPRLMSIVTEDDAAAAAAIEYLRKNNLGRAGFLPLNKMIPVKPRGKALMVVKDPACQGFALDLVKFNKKYESAFSYVFGDTLVMGDLETARKNMGGVRLVTLKGDLLEAAGAMVGGSMHKKDQIKFAGKDVSKLAELEAELHRTTELMDGLGEDLVAVRQEIQAAEAELSGARSGQNVELKVHDLEARKKEFQQKLEKAAKDIEERAAVRRGLEDSLAKLEEKIETGTARIAELEATREETGRLLLKGTKKEIADKATSLEARVNDLRNEVLEAQSGAQTVAKQHGLVQEKSVEIEARLKEIVAEITRLQQDADSHKGRFKELEEKLGVLTKADANLSGKAKQLYEKKEKLSVRLKELEGKIDNVQTKMQTTESLLAAQNSKLPTLEEELGNALAEISEFKLAEPDPENALTYDEARKQLAQVERDIESLGPVNQRALEMHDEQTKREGELLEEVDRLNKQRENLIQVVDEITTKKSGLFMEVFDAVNENVKRIYNRLTDGGEAFLELENPKNIFEGGLTMKATPSGKKVVRLQSLSGGEKSMTALALIFAIQEYEPSPFYLLDEVDQNLDGVNAELVAHMVKENAESAQFIMVSLRKVTLKEADHLYGVTMAGNGLSQLVANFDFNALNEQGELVNTDGGGGSTTLVKGGGDRGNGSPPGDGGSSDKGIRETVKGMMKVEADR